MRHVLRVSGMRGEDAVERQRLASRLLRGLTKFRAKGWRGKKNNAEEIPTGNCANDVTLTAEKRSHSSVQNECGFKLDHLARRDRHVDFFAHANGFALQQGKNKLHKHKNINLHNVSCPIKYELAVTETTQSV